MSGGKRKVLSANYKICIIPKMEKGKKTDDICKMNCLSTSTVLTIQSVLDENNRQVERLKNVNKLV